MSNRKKIHEAFVAWAMKAGNYTAVTRDSIGLWHGEFGARSEPLTEQFLSFEAGFLAGSARAHRAGV